MISSYLVLNIHGSMSGLHIVSLILTIGNMRNLMRLSLKNSKLKKLRAVIIHIAISRIIKFATIFFIVAVKENGLKPFQIIFTINLSMCTHSTTIINHDKVVKIVRVYIIARCEMITDGLIVGG